MKNWPMVPLNEVLCQVSDPHPVRADQNYPTFGVYGFGRGLFQKPPISGSTIKASTLFRVRKSQFVYSRLKAFEGAYALVTEELDGHYVSNEFPTFNCLQDRILPEYLSAYFKAPSVWKHAAKFSTGVGARRERIHPQQLLSLSVPLPSLDEQHRLVVWINDLSRMLQEAQSTTESIISQNKKLLASAYADISFGSPRRKLLEIAPLTRRRVKVDPLQVYPSVSVRSFGKGTFHNPPLLGANITWEKPHLVREGDILVSNIKAWEGAIAVAQPEDDGYCGSHRYLTYTPIPGIATARFICFHLLTSEGLHQVGEASPGSADRNRTTSARALLDILIPVPSYEHQLWFGHLYDKIKLIQTLQEQATEKREIMLSAILNRAFEDGL